MSEGFAKKESLEQRRGQRRFRDYQWSDVGGVILQSATAGEWVRIDSAQQRARMAAMAGNKKGLDAATQDFLLEVLAALVLDGDKNHFFVAADKDLILSLDSALTDPLVSAAVEFAGLDEVSVGAAQKNLSTTQDGKTPSGSGST